MFENILVNDNTIPGINRLHTNIIDLLSYFTNDNQNASSKFPPYVTLTIKQGLKFMSVYSNN
jgi:hypothetical protein